jgi:copper(I)-binding protein
MKKRQLLFTIFGILPSVFAQAKPLAVPQGFVRELPASALNTAAYVTLNNPNQVDKVIVAISTPVADSVLFHRMVPTENNYSMAKDKQLVVPAQGSLALKATQKHLMLMQLKSALKLGQMIPFTLSFKDGSKQTIHLPVQNSRMTHRKNKP